MSINNWGNGLLFKALLINRIVTNITIRVFCQYLMKQSIAIQLVLLHSMFSIAKEPEASLNNRLKR